MTTPRPAIRLATFEDAGPIAGLVADAFLDYEWSRWAVPADNRRERLRGLHLLRAWRRTERPVAPGPELPDEPRLRRARKQLAEFGALWRNPAVPDRLREEALHEIFARVDVQGTKLLTVHPQPNENAWPLGLVALRQKHDQHVGLVGARGLEPPVPTPRIVVPDWLAQALRGAA